MSFSQSLREGAQALGKPLSDGQCDALATYQGLLERWAPKVNLVGDARPETTVETHFVDSVAILRALPNSLHSLTDIGSGAGFPGLVLAIVAAECTVRLVEPIGKRASFLQQVIARVGVPNASVQIARSTELATHSCEAVISRAVLPPSEWIVEGGRLVEPGGHLLLMTAQPPAPNLIMDAQKEGLQLDFQDVFQLPTSQTPRCTTRFRRESA